MSQGGLSKVFGVLSTAALTRILGNADFGLYSFVINTTSTVYGFVKLGTDAAITVISGKFKNEEGNHKQFGEMLGAAMILLFISGLLGAFVCLFLSDFISNSILKSNHFSPYIKFVSVFVLLQCISQFFTCTIIGFKNFAQYAKVMLSNSILGLFLSLITGIKFGIVGSVIGLALTQIISLVMLFKIFKSAINLFNIKVRFSNFISESKRILKLGFPFYLSCLAIIPCNYYAQVLLIQNSGVESIGGIRIISTIITIVTFVPNSITSIVLQKLSSVSNSRAEFLNTTFLFLKFSWIFAIIIGIIGSIFTPLFISLVFGSSFIFYYKATCLSIFSTVCTISIGIVSNAAFSSGRVILILKYTIFQSVFFIISAIALIPKYGIIGFFISEIFGGISIFVFLLFFYEIRSEVLKKKWVIHAFYITFIYLICVLSFVFNQAINNYIILILFLLFFLILVKKFILTNFEKNILLEVFKKKNNS